MKRVLLPAMIAGLSFAGGPAEAGQTSTTMGVSMTIVSSCTVSVPTPLAFGSLTAIDMSAVRDEQTAGVIRVTCTNGEDYTVSLGVGLGDSASFATRKMTGGPGNDKTINYSLYRDAGRTEVWGDGTGGTNTVTQTGNGDPQDITVYGQVPQQNNLFVGAYSDTIAVTVDY